MLSSNTSRATTPKILRDELTTYVSSEKKVGQRIHDGIKFHLPKCNWDAVWKHNVVIISTKFNSFNS